MIVPPADPFAELSAAVRADDVARAADLLRSHRALASRLDGPIPEGFCGATALLTAVQHRSRAMIDLLLEHGANIDAKSDWWAGGFGVLHLCELDLAPALVERGATVDSHAAARLGVLERLDELVSRDPSFVHARGGDGQTPLHFASTVEIAAYLLGHGADIDARDIDHESTPAQHMLGDRADVARFLVRRGCRTDILMAAALGELELVRRMLDDDPDVVRTRVTAEWFPMRDPRAGGTIYIWTIGRNATAHTAAHARGHDRVLELLMERSSDELRLTQACELGDDAACQALLARRPDLARSLSEGERRALVEAVRQDNRSAVRLMLAAGWPVDVRGDEGATPLHVAAWLGNAELVRELVRHGAPVEIRGDRYDSTPLEWAMHGSVHSWRKEAGDYAAVVDLLIDAGARAPAGGEGVHASETVRGVLKKRASGGA